MSLAAFGAAPSEVVEREPAFSAKTLLDTLHDRQVDDTEHVREGILKAGLPQ
jgi:hypothetical protein